MAKANNGPRLKLNERGIYEIHWTEAGRSRRSSTRTSDYESAKKVLAAFLTLDGQDQRRGGAGPLLVMDVLGDPDAPDGEDYWHEHVLPECADKETPRFAYVKLLKHFGALAVKDVAPADVRAYVADRRAGRLGRPSVNHTISRELSVLNAALSHAVKEKRLSAADKPFVKLPGHSAPRDRWLRFPEAEALLQAALKPIDPHQDKDKLPRVYRFTMIALEAASRKTAALQLQRKMVDLKAGLIDFNPPGRVQTNKKRPVVRISSRLRPVLERTLLEIPDHPDAYLLDHSGCIRTSFENCVERAGLGSDVTPHVLRHTKATWAAQAGVDMFKIANMLGDSVATVIKNYAHHHPDYQKDAVEVGPGARLKAVGGTAA